MSDDLIEIKQILTGKIDGTKGLVHIVAELADWSKKADLAIFGSHNQPGLLAHVYRHNDLERKVEGWGSRIVFWTVTTLVTALISVLVFLGNFLWNVAVGGGGG